MKPSRPIASFAVAASVLAVAFASTKTARADESASPPPAAPEPLPAASAAPAPSAAPPSTWAPVAVPPAGVTLRSDEDSGREVERRWYGWQTLMVDGISLVTTPIIIGIPGLFLGAPIVHAAHDRWDSAGISFAMRGGGAAAVALYIGAQDHRGDFAGLAVLAEAVVGAFIVHSVATSIDAAVLAYDERPARSRRAGASSPAPVRLLPTANVARDGGFTLGLAGTM